MSDSPRALKTSLSGPIVAKASYSTAVKKGILKNPNDVNMATPAPIDTDQGKAQIRANQQFGFPISRLDSVSEINPNKNPFDGNPKTTKFFQGLRKENLKLAKNAVANSKTSVILKKANTTKSVTFKPTVDVIEFEVSHYNDFEPTPVTAKSNYTDYLKRADEVSICLSNIIKYIVPENGEINDTIETVIEEKISDNPYLLLRQSMSEQIGEDKCDAFLSGPSLIGLDNVYKTYNVSENGDNNIKVTFLDYAIARAVQNYKESGYLTELIRGILTHIINPIRERLGIGGRRTRRSKRSKKSKRRTSKRRTLRRNSSRKNFARKNFARKN